MATTDSNIVVIIDRDPKRKQKMGVAFDDLADVRIVYRKSSSRFAFKTVDGRDIESAGRALIALRHFRDSDDLPDLEAYMTVYYGGNGSDDPACPPDAEERIEREVTSKLGTLTPAEARRLLDYATYKRLGDNPRRPSFLAGAPAYRILPALSILCQGYLAIYAQHGQKQSCEMPEAVTYALELMGWDKLLLDKDPILLSLRSGRDLSQRVIQRDWWLGVFGVLDEQLAVSTKEFEEFTDSLDEEWRRFADQEIPDDLSRLIQKLSTSEHFELTEQNAMLAARAYRLITEERSAFSYPR